MKASPDSIHFDRAVDTSTVAGCQIQNIGTGALDWNAVASVGWINILRDSGSDNDSMVIQIETALLAPGLHSGAVTVLDSLAFNRQIEVSVRVNVPPADTVRIGNVRAIPGNSAVISIDVTLSSLIKGGVIPLRYDPERINYDSISFQATDLSAGVELTSEIYDSSTIAIRFLATDSGVAIGTGEYHIADLYMTAGQIPGVCGIDTAYNDTVYLRLIGINESEIAPIVIPGTVTIDEPTTVGEFEDKSNPAEFALSPNFPNPFNGQTVFELTLSERAEVTVEIFNILGQRIARIQDGPLGAGRHKISWDGNMAGVLPAPSGIYFCRAATERSIQIRKLLLLR